MNFANRDFDFKNNSFDFIRLVLAILVVIYHSNLYGMDFYERPNWLYYPVAGWSNGQTHLGEIAVYGFFLISGFLITFSALRSQTIGQFFYRRIVRIMPGFLVALFCTAFVFVPIMTKLSGNSLDSGMWLETSGYFFQNVFLEIRVEAIKSAYKWGGLNGSTWTLIQEFRAYALVAGLAFIGWLQKPRIVISIGVLINIISFFCTRCVEFSAWIDQIFYDHRFFSLFAYFWVGTLYCIYFQKLVWNYKWFCVAILGLLIGFVTNAGMLLFPISGGYLLLFLSQILPFQNLSKKIGDWSYGVYIYSTPIQITLKLAGIGKFGFLAYASMSLALSLFAGFVSWHLVEKHFLKRR